MGKKRSYGLLPLDEHTAPGKACAKCDKEVKDRHVEMQGTDVGQSITHRYLEKVLCRFYKSQRVEVRYHNPLGIACRAGSKQDIGQVQVYRVYP